MTDAPKLTFGHTLIPSVNTIFGGTVDDQLVNIRDVLKNIILVIEELKSRTLAAPKTAQDGLPLHGQPAGLVLGQWLRLTQAAASPSLHTVNHGLGRTPQGAVFIKTTGINKVLIAGNNTGVAPASSSVVVFELNGAINEEHICCLF